MLIHFIQQLLLMNTFKERKQYRTDYYFKYVYRWKLRPCSACSGSGYYDNHGNPKCAGCNGTGKVKFKDT